jgi:aminopeptidase N
LLTMLRDYIGEDAFREGLKSYFKKYAYGNTSRDDLWQELSLSSGQDIGKLMTPWIQQSGQPLLSVSQEKDKLRLTQKRFLLDGEDNDTLWPIPLLADKKLGTGLLDKRSLELPFANKTMPVFNVEGSGHFIVCYEDDKARDNLKAKVIDRSIDAVGRINVINDMLLLARDGEYSLTEILDLVGQCQREPRAAVWSMFMRALSQAQAFIDGDKTAEKHLRSYKRNLAGHWYEKLGWTDRNGDDPNTKHLRTTALALSIAGENPDALQHALAAFDKAGSVEKLPAEQRAMIAGAAVRFGKPAFIKKLMDEYQSSPNPDVQQAIALALCSTKKPDEIKRLIKWGLDKDGAVRPQDIGHWFAYLMRNYYSRELAWNWLTSNWPRLLELFDGGKYMEYFIWYSAGPLSTTDWQARFKKFFEPKTSEPALKRNIQISFSEIAARIQWHQREEKHLKEYFEKADKP